MVCIMVCIWYVYGMYYSLFVSVVCVYKLRLFLFMNHCLLICVIIIIYIYIYIYICIEILVVCCLLLLFVLVFYVVIMSFVYKLGVIVLTAAFKTHLRRSALE